MKSIAFAALTLLVFLAPTRAQERPRPPLPPGVKVLRDLEYVPGGGRAQSLDLYLPEHADGPLPLVVWIHGGAWSAGSKDRNAALPLMREGFATASVEYRFSQQAVFPAQIEDCKAAIRFLRANAAQYGLDPARIGVWGSSAGGHLVAMLGTAGGVAAWEKGEHLDMSSRVQAVCDWFGPSDLLTMGAQGANHRPMPATDSAESPESKLIGGAIPENSDKAQAASPVTYVSAEAPPFLIVHGDKDPLVPLAQSQELHAALEKAGVETKLHIVAGGGHGQGFDTPEIAQLVREFFVQHLKK